MLFGVKYSYISYQSNKLNFHTISLNFNNFIIDMNTLLSANKMNCSLWWYEA